MFTNEEANSLIELEKVLEDPNQDLSLKDEKLRIDLIAPEEPDYKFFIDVNPNKRIQFKLTLHGQEKYSNIGLLRIDYKGSHINPEHLLDTLPDFLRPYAGQEFRREAHIHFYVEGYRPLAWAMPLKEHSFDVKELASEADYVAALTNFAKLLNVQSKLSVQMAMMI
jgi:hypothetical protein